MNKKGDGEQFSWIFIIVAGSIILGFFVMFAFKYVALQSQKENAKLSSGIYNELYTLQKSGFKTETDIPLFTDKEITITCDKFQLGNFAPESLSREFIFSPSKMTTNKINLWMMGWDYPFRISNFFYLTSNEEYFLVYDSSSEEFVKSLRFPKNFNVKVTNVESSKGKNIYFKNSNKGVSIPANESGYLKIDGKQYPYFGLPMLYGAIFSDNYGCILDRALEKYRIIIDIYSEKAEMLASIKPICGYDSLKRDLLLLDKAVVSKDYEKIFDLSNKLSLENENLVGGGCNPLF